MAMLGPVVVITETTSAELVGLLGKAGAFPIVETRLAAAPAAIAEIQPVALLLAQSLTGASDRDVKAWIRTVQARRGPIMPVLMDAKEAKATAIPFAVPFSTDEPAPQIVARLRAALRVRTLHTTVLRRSNDTQFGRYGVPPSDLLNYATVLCLGRGRSYPALSTAVGEQVGLMGAMSIETAARALQSRDLDGIVIGDGFSPKIVDTLLTAIAEDPEFRDLPVGVFGNSAHKEDRLPNFFHIESDLSHLMAWLLPLVQIHAFTSHLNRTLKSLDSKGAIDSETGLVASNAFWRELDRAIHEAEDGGSALSVARFSFEEIDDRLSIDVARLFSRLVRSVDFACRESDGSILAAFTDTDLRSAHVVARRLAGTLRQTIISSDRDRDTIKPTVTLATLKPTDNLSSLVARIGTYPTVAAG
jgi:GGDEF domain-containing protein